MYRVGDCIVYRITKHSPHPTLRAIDVEPSPHGEFYTYTVLKYWVVQKVHADGVIEARTRRGKTRIITPHDPQIRSATWWERLFFSHRFPKYSPDIVALNSELQAAG